MSRLLGRAFAALGPGPTRRELELVADVLRKSGDREALDALAGDPEAVAQLADANGSHGLVALDLQIVVCHGIDGLTRKSVYRPRGRVSQPGLGRYARRAFRWVSSWEAAVGAGAASYRFQTRKRKPALRH